MALVTALVCTRNRPGMIGRAVRSLLASEGVDLELIVVDQSDGRETELGLAAIGDPRLRVVRSAARGKGAALNHGLQLARGEVLVCTDDDCEAPPSWVASMAGLLEARPTTAVVFCSVAAGPHDAGQGYVPVYACRRSRLVRSLSGRCAPLGMGAGMALRRDVAVALGGFDESIGPGAFFPSGDDWDIAVRSLIRGWHVYEAAEVGIIHHGFRAFAQGREHQRRDWLGIGAVCTKAVRAGSWGTLALPLSLFFRFALWPPIRDALHLKRPRGATRIVAFVQGAVRALRTPIDPKTLWFAPLAAAPEGGLTPAPEAGSTP